MRLLRSWLLFFFTPIQKILQRLGNPEPRISSKFVDRVLKEIEKGDLLISREEWKFTNPLVPGFWGHCAIYIGDESVVEAVSSGVKKENLSRWLYQKDSVALLRPTALPSKIRFLVAKFALDQIGKKYDYLFKPNAKAFYCSELYLYCLNKAYGGLIKIKHKDAFGVKTSTPQDLYEMKIFMHIDEEINK
jgi:uncharacterized protein YycO